LLAAFVALVALDGWVMVEVERLVIVHGHHKDFDFWTRVALLAVVIVLLSWFAVGVALRALSARRP